MEPTTDSEQRLTNLEIKASFTEDMLEQLDQVVVRQQQQIELLIREIAQLRQMAPEVPSSGGRNLRDELPPHF